MQICPSTDSAVVFIEIASTRNGLERRSLLRKHWVSSCFDLVNAKSSRRYDYSFFISSRASPDQDDNDFLKLSQETDEFHDIVFVDVPDSDPLVARDETYLLEGATSVTAKALSGMEYALKKFPALEFYFHLDSDSFLSLTRLDDLLTRHPWDYLVLGYLMSPPMDLELADVPFCKECAHQYSSFCDASGLGPLSCYQTGFTCDLHGYGFEETDSTQNRTLLSCMQGRAKEAAKLHAYFQNGWSPPWALGMGIALGRQVVKYLVANSEDFKQKASFDLQLGWWLAPLRDAVFVHTDSFHDYPRKKSMFAKPCTDSSILVHRMRPANWMQVDNCVLECPKEKIEDEVR